MLRVLVSGASGVIGRHVIALIEADPELTLAGQADQDRFFEPSVQADVLIDFSHPALTLKSLDLACALGIPAVIGTTGLDAACRARLDSAAAEIPLCVAANFSVGVTVMLELARRAASALDPSFDMEISEIHHRRKLDAPSGTALALGEALAAGRGQRLADVQVHDRSARRVARPSTEIGIQSLRGGDVAGEHTVFFLGDGERLEISHRATDRSIFARGALLAAGKLVGQPAGRVAFADILFA